MMVWLSGGIMAALPSANLKFIDWVLPANWAESESGKFVSFPPPYRENPASLKMWGSGSICGHVGCGTVEYPQDDHQGNPIQCRPLNDCIDRFVVAPQRKFIANIAARENDLAAELSVCSPSREPFLIGHPDHS